MPYYSPCLLLRCFKLIVEVWLGQVPLLPFIQLFDSPLVSSVLCVKDLKKNKPQNYMKVEKVNG